jgi:hypothetical protein
MVLAATSGWTVLATLGANGRVYDLGVRHTGVAVVACILVAGALAAGAVTVAAITQGDSSNAESISCLQGLRMRPHHCYLPVHGASEWAGLMEIAHLQWLRWTPDSAVARGFVLDSEALDPDGKRNPPAPVRLAFFGSLPCKDSVVFARLRMRRIGAGEVEPMFLSCFDQ